jgi:hypothetical protein
MDLERLGNIQLLLGYMINAREGNIELAQKYLLEILRKMEGKA